MKKKIKRPNMSELAKQITKNDTAGRQMDIAQAKETLRFLQGCFEQDPVGMFRLFTKNV